MKALTDSVCFIVIVSVILAGFHLHPVAAHSESGPTMALTKIRPAPDIRLTAQNGRDFRLSDLRGKVVALSFIFTRCIDTCPLVVYKLVGLQDGFEGHFGKDVYFVSVTVDPDHDTPQVLAGYADAQGCKTEGWSFLTGDHEAIRNVARSYGVIHSQGQDDGEVRHNLLTTLIDRNGIIRVQYMGDRFDPKELMHDLRDLIEEGRGT